MDAQHEWLQKTAVFLATINQFIVDCVEFFAIFVHCHRKSSILVQQKQNELHWKAFQSHWLSKEWQNDNFMNGELNTKGQQLNSEWIYEVIFSPKMPTKNFSDFCPFYKKPHN